MSFENLITTQLWLQASTPVRQHISEEFGMKRSTSPRCITELGETRIESDGFTLEDLRALNVITMQKWLGFSKIDLQADVFALFEMCAQKAEKDLENPPVQIVEPEKIVGSTGDGEAPESIPEAPLEKESDVLGPKPDALKPEDKPETPQEKPPFCESCDSKGVRHKKECPKFK